VKPVKRYSYKEAGVDVDKGDDFVRSIKSLVEGTFRPDVLTKLGGFAGCVSLNLQRYKKPVLVSSTDGVGTKLKIALAMDRHDTVGIDLVAMCVNDIIVIGARPLFLLDYLAVSKLDPNRAKKVVGGIAKGCLEAECSLIGGETAEMPGFYKKGEYDLAGFVVGILDEGQMIDGSGIRIGDRLIGIASSGLHSNGFSLVRKVLLERHKLDLRKRVAEIGEKLGETLLRPTRIYVKTILNLLKDFSPHGMAHITGGGITGNLPRILPKGCKAVIQKGTWDVPPIFPFLQERGNISEDEMYKTFNNGIGMILVIPPKDAQKVMARLQALGEKGFIIGEIVKADKPEEAIALV
jgi:phosphoribosylformylglycinamidine cyclo-ligase